jgi:septal ring factor EnvC (AmiA/AmiB activator)
VAALQDSLNNESSRTIQLRDEVGDRTAEVSRLRGEVRDLQTELEVAQSGAGFSSVSEQVARLTRERDELKTRLERLLRAVGKDGLKLVRPAPPTS